MWIAVAVLLALAVGWFAGQCYAAARRAPVMVWRQTDGRETVEHQPVRRRR